MWTLDAEGNWSSLQTDGMNEGRSHNRQNQITQIGGSVSLAYDNNGNLITDENGQTLVYDAWNRLVAYKDGATTLASYAYDATRVIAHSHPSGRLGISPLDYTTYFVGGQHQSTVVVGPTGAWRRFTSYEGVLGGTQ